MGVDECSFEFRPADGLRQLREVPSVDHGDVDPGFRGDPHAERIEDAGLGRVMLLVYDLSESGYVHPGDLLGVRVGAGVGGVDGIHRGGVDHAVGLHGPRDHHRHRIRGMAGLCAAHDDYAAGPGEPCRLLGCLGDLVRHVAESKTQQLSVQPGGAYAHDVQLAGVSPKFPACGGVVARRAPSSDDDRDLHLVLQRQ